MPLSLAAATLGAAGIGAATSLYGGARAKKGQKDLLKLQMDESIQRRVKDAQAAGVHPLFALGASVGASPSTMAGDSGVAAAGEALGRGLTGYARAKAGERAEARQDALLASQVKAAEAAASKDVAQGLLYDAERKRLEQDLVSRGHDGVKSDFVMKRYVMPQLPQGGQEYVDIPFGPANVVPPEVPTQSSVGVSSGVFPMRETFVDTDGTVVQFYSRHLEADELKQAQILLYEWGRYKDREKKRIEADLRKLGVKVKRLGKKAFRPGERRPFRGGSYPYSK